VGHSISTSHQRKVWPTWGSSRPQIQRHVHTGVCVCPGRFVGDWRTPDYHSYYGQPLYTCYRFLCKAHHQVHISSRSSNISFAYNMQCSYSKVPCQVLCMLTHQFQSGTGRASRHQNAAHTSANSFIIENQLSKMQFQAKLICAQWAWSRKDAQRPLSVHSMLPCRRAVCTPCIWLEWELCLGMQLLSYMPLLMSIATSDCYG
jgi:hypothetical protein